MNKQEYHKPEFRLYGNISVMTQNSGMTLTSSSDGGAGAGKNKTS